MEVGRFIVLEGIDGCGKTTQAQMLKDYLESQGQEVVLTREPGGTEVGEEIRQVLLKKRDQMMDPVTQTLLFFAARTEFIEGVVRLNLKEGKTVITDRFVASTYVYQGEVQGVDKELIDDLNKRVVTESGAVPDLYVIIDITAEESRKRNQNDDRKGQDTIYEQQGLEFARKLRDGYLIYARQNTDAVVVNGMNSPEQVHQDIVRELQKV